MSKLSAQKLFDNDEQNGFDEQNENNSETVQELNLKYLKRTFLRRKKFITGVFLISFSLSLGFTIYRRIFDPLFVGGFSVLIADPLDVGNRNSRDTEDFIGNLARNRNTNDIPTLIEVLKSPLLINNVAKKYGISSGEFVNNLVIEVPSNSSFKYSPSVLRVKIFNKNKLVLYSILNDLSNLYLQTALDQKQKRLYEGLAFLNKQAPEDRKSVV